MAFYDTPLNKQKTVVYSKFDQSAVDNFVITRDDELHKISILYFKMTRLEEGIKK